MVVAIVALCAALTGGAYAAGRIGTKQLRHGAVTTGKLAPNERSLAFTFFDANNMALPAGQFTPVANLVLPRGDYIVTAQVGIDSDDPQEVECQIQDDGARAVRAITGLPTTTGGSRRGTITLTAPVDGGGVSLACFPDEASTARDRMITAVRVGHLILE